MDGCCQYFPTLTQDDLDTINGHNKLMIVLTFICSFFGALLFSIWGIFL